MILLWGSVFLSLKRTLRPAPYLVFSVVFLFSCKVELPKPPLVETVAVLPFDNESNNLNAPDIMQALVYLALKPSAYRVSNFKEVNAFLEEVGIVDGGQLAAVDPVKLGKDLNVQALLTGYVESFNYVNIGFYTERKVKLQLKLIDVKTGTTLWENGATAVNRKFTLDAKDAQGAFLQGITDAFVDKLFKTPLGPEARQATVDALRTLPGFKFTVFAEDPTSLEEIGKSMKRILKPPK